MGMLVSLAFLFIWTIVGIIVSFIICNFVARFELFPTGASWWRESITTFLLGPLFWILGLITLASLFTRKRS